MQKRRKKNENKKLYKALKKYKESERNFLK